MRRGIRRFWHDLRRRRLFSTGALYVVVAWAFVQAAAIAFPAFGVPDWVMRALLVAAFAGFPVALVLAWVFDFTARGVEVTAPSEGSYASNRRPPRWWIRPLIAAPVLALVVGGSVWLWSSRLSHTGESEFVSQTRPDELPVLAVLPLENLTGRREMAWAGPAIATLVRDDLAQSRLLVVVSTARTARMVAQDKDPQRLFAKALDDGITHVLTGEILRTPKGLTVTSRVTDLRRNVEISANRREGLQAEDALAASTSIATLVKQGLGLPGTEKVDVFAADFAARNVPAYEAFIAGMENFLRFDYPSAQQGFEAAVRKAPDFAVARYRLAHTLAALGDTDGAITQIQLAQRDAARLPQRDKAYIAAAGYYFRRQYPQAEKAYRDLLAQYPYETEARLLLLYVLMDQDRYREALVEAETLAGQDPGDEVAWSAVGDLNLKLGHYEDAEKALAKLVAIAPGNPNARYLQGESQFFRTRYGEATKHYVEALRLDPAFGDASLRLADIEVLRGRPEDAIAMLQRMLRTNTLSPSLRISAAFNLAALQRALGRCAQVGATLDRVHAQIVAEQVREALELATRSGCRLEEGDIAQALQLADAAVAKSPGKATRYLFAKGLAQVAAGDPVSLQRTIAALRALAAPRQDPDRAEEKAATYLAGLMQLKLGNARAAVPLLRSAVRTEGYEYDLYKLGLARALLASGSRREAHTIAREAARVSAPAELRVELEPSRRAAVRLLQQLGG